MRKSIDRPRVPRISNLRVAWLTAGDRRRLGKVFVYPDKSETNAGSREWPYTERASAAYDFVAC